MTGLGLPTLADMDPVDLESLAEFAREREQRREWANSTELLAKLVELNAAILARLNAGLPVHLMKGRPAQTAEPYEVERPPWVQRPSSDQVVSPREFFQMMRRG